jgi:succinate dehydrogenase/fumarate reductase flavoprotein subunit
MENLSRRSFIRGTGLVAAGVAASGLAACSTDAPTAGDTSDKSWQPATWDQEVDVVIVGYGGAGATAAIACAKEGVSFVVLEKSSERDGGSTGCSGGHIHTCIDVDLDEWVKTFLHGGFGSCDEATAKVALAHANETRAWLDETGYMIVWAEEGGDGHKRPVAYRGGYVTGYDGIVGKDLFEMIDDLASRTYDIDDSQVLLSHRAIKLVQRPSDGTICGVIADNNGTEKSFLARRGVILACGGYENNPWLQFNYNSPGVRVFPWGTPNNTGDGIMMAGAVGAEIWHTHALEHAAWCYQLPSQEANCSISTDATDGIVPYNYIVVNPDGKRFTKEDKTGAHDMDPQSAFDFDSKTCDYNNLPMFLVFDQTFFDEHNPLWDGSGRAGIINTYAGVWNFRHPDNPLLEWKSNDDAVAKGWMFKGETIAELAAAIKGQRPCDYASELLGYASQYIIPEEVDGIPAEALQGTIETWNQYCAAGADPDFGRDPKHMLPIETGPYYAIQLGFSSINTQGGPRRDGDCQTLATSKVTWTDGKLSSTPGDPIPHLYNAGECGSYNGYVYCYGNIFEALVTGRVAAYKAMENEPWS